MSNDNRRNNSTSRILFGSCNSQHHKQVLWPSILSRNPSAFVWGGDAIYADSHVKEATPEITAELYREQKEHVGYKRLLDTKIPILGVLDDHDYGVNNGDKTYRYRRESGIALACDFLGQEGAAICDRARKGMGVYGVQVMDFSRVEGHELLTDIEAGLDPDVTTTNNDGQYPALSNRSVAIFLLDVRSNRTPYTKKGIEALLDNAEYDGDILGETQWEWLEGALGRSNASVNIIVQGLQLHANRPGPVESWSRFPSSQHRMYQLLLQKHVKAPIVVSGDVHHAQMLRKDCHFVDKGRVAQPRRMLLEVTTSGMTHSWGSEICARPHQLCLCRMPHVKFAASRAMALAQWINGAKVWTELLDLSGAELDHLTEAGGKLGMQYALERNFAEFDFDWIDRSVIVRILGEKVDGVPLLSSKWAFNSLTGGIQNSISGSGDDNAFVDSYDEVHRLGGFDSVQDGQWICRHYRGTPSPVFKVVGVVVPILFGFGFSFAPFVIPVILIILWLFKSIRSCLSKSKQA